ncbi:phytoene desaturase family protein [Priestia abyssalis]|uniref:phytoene desaturase family protein n=1 Tax=Priestia abyssalis TaxID=1221450 RepID=UPI000995255F|nr:phytoene desaturase family protein [Priestia abyssalis]
MKRVLIVGGGLGGLAAGMKLQANGYKVSIFEQNHHFGGKMVPIQLGDYSFDFGPNTITMPQVFQEILTEAGENPDDYLEFIKLETHTVNFFPDGTPFFMTTDRNKMVEQLERLDSHAEISYYDYLEEVKILYETVEKQFFYRTFSSWTDYFDPSLFQALWSVHPFETMDHFHRQFFRNDYVRHAFNRYAAYIGSSPFSAPAAFAYIGHLEFNDGVYYVKGGNTKISEAFTSVLTKLGANLYTSTKVRKIMVEQKQAKGIELENGETVMGDIIIVNGDVLTAYPDLVEEKRHPHFKNGKADRYEPSLSAFVIMAGLKERNPHFIHHQVYSSSDYEAEFHELFQEKRLPSDPTIYIWNSSYIDPQRAPGDNLFIFVNAPADSGSFSYRPEEYKHLIYKKLKRFGVDIPSQLVVEKVITPGDLASAFSAYKGASYGIRSTRKLDSFLRSSNKSKDISNLYFSDGTTHPAGAPMAVISGINAADAIIHK